MGRVVRQIGLNCIKLVHMLEHELQKVIIFIREVFITEKRIKGNTLFFLDSFTLKRITRIMRKNLTHIL